jgi:hypothetical protein
VFCPLSAALHIIFNLSSPHIASYLASHVKVLEYGQFSRAVDSGLHGESLEYGPQDLLDPTDHVTLRHLKFELITHNHLIVKIQQLTCCVICTLYSVIDITQNFCLV